MFLKEIAHARTGDKGEISNISVIPYFEEDYDFLKEVLTVEKVKEYFEDICKGRVTRYGFEGIKGINFCLDKTLGGGVTRSLGLDKHGKSLSSALLEMEIPEGSPSVLAGRKVIADTQKQCRCDSEKTIDDVLSGKRIRIGSGAGYAGDRLDPTIELMEKGNLDYIIFECLAERTIALGQKNKQLNPKLGYNELLEYRMERILPLAKKNRIKVITNMGSANPQAAAEKTVAIAKRLGIEGLKIACVLGDDIYDNIENYMNKEILESGKKLSSLKECLVSANAYCGAEGILEALNGGADIVITGRVSDPALVVGPLIYEYGWNVDDNPNQMGQAILAGHLLECAGQVSGGYFAEPGYKEVTNLDRLGFPLIEIDESGKFVVTKVEGSGGAVTTDTCKEQMMYEIHNPKKYMTPDAIADFSHASLQQLGKDVVMVNNATSHGKPEKLKVSVGYEDCYIGEGEISYGGKNCLEKADLAADILKKRLEIIGVKPEELRVDYIGYNSLYKNKISDKFLSSPGEIRLRISVRTKDRNSAVLAANDVEALYTNGPSGGGGVVKRVTEVLSVCSIFVDRKDIGHVRCVLYKCLKITLN